LVRLLPRVQPRHHGERVTRERGREGGSVCVREREGERERERERERAGAREKKMYYLFWGWERPFARPTWPARSAPYAEEG